MRRRRRVAKLGGEEHVIARQHAVCEVAAENGADGALG